MVIALWGANKKNEEEPHICSFFILSDLSPLSIFGKLKLSREICRFGGCSSGPRREGQIQM